MSRPALQGTVAEAVDLAAKEAKLKEQARKKKIFDVGSIQLYNCTMEMIIDASAVLAVLLNEPERDGLIKITVGASLAAPACLEYEIGNALSALMKRKSLTISEAVSAYHEFCKIPVRSLPANIPAALVASGEEGIYAYDAYYLTCAEQLRLSILTLDKHLTATATKRGIQLVEVQ